MNAGRAALPDASVPQLIVLGLWQHLRHHWPLMQARTNPADAAAGVGRAELAAGRGRRTSALTKRDRLW
jgi:hypothetical protein